MRVLADAPPAAGSLDPVALQVNPCRAAWPVPAPQVVLVPVRSGAHNGGVALATLFLPERTRSSFPMTRYSHA